MSQEDDTAFIQEPIAHSLKGTISGKTNFPAGAWEAEVFEGSQTQTGKCERESDRSDVRGKRE